MENREISPEANLTFTDQAVALPNGGDSGEEFIFFCIKYGSQIYSTLELDNNNDPNGADRFDRNNDTESKIIEEIVQKFIPSMNISPSDKLNLKLYTERFPCDSCYSVIERFVENYNNIDVEILFCVGQ